MNTVEKCLPITSDEMLEIVKRNGNQNILLAEDFSLQYDVLTYKKKIMTLFKKIKCKRLLVLAEKLTFEERIYFVYTFLSKKSEDTISDILRISRTSLQKIKKSCLIKAWFELEKFCEND